MGHKISERDTNNRGVHTTERTVGRNAVILSHWTVFYVYWGYEAEFSCIWNGFWTIYGCVKKLCKSIYTHL